MWLRFLTFPLALLGGLIAAGLCLAGLVVALAYPNLPSLDTLTDYQPKVPLRIYTAEGTLIGEFGEERRVLVDIKQAPPMLTNAIIAAEDERFYQHSGIDYMGVARAAYANLVTGGRRQGASTITMQVARNFFLSSEKTLTRKLYEVLLALIEIDQRIFPVDPDTLRALKEGGVSERVIVAIVKSGRTVNPEADAPAAIAEALPPPEPSVVYVDRERPVVREVAVPVPVAVSSCVPGVDGV